MCKEDAEENSEVDLVDNGDTEMDSSGLGEIL